MSDLFEDDLPESDDLDALIAAPKRATPGILEPLPLAGHQETCPSCRGTGRFTSYSGRHVGACFKCKGSGFLVFKTPKAVRQQNQARKIEREIKTTAENLAAFTASYPGIVDWFTRNTGFAFAISMREAVEKYGYLTENQLAACARCANRDLNRQAEAVARVEAAPTVDLTAIDLAFSKASKAQKRPRLRVAGFTISPAPANGKNAGALYVKAKGGVYLGKIAGGKFLASRDCTPELAQRAVEVARDPQGAAIAYGRETGICSCCGAELTNKESIARGIGPICAQNFGW